MKIVIENELGWDVVCKIDVTNPVYKATDVCGEFRMHVEQTNRDKAVMDFTCQFIRVFGSTSQLMVTPGDLTVTPSAE